MIVPNRILTHLVLAASFCFAAKPLQASSYDLRFGMPEHLNCDGVPQQFCASLQIRATAGQPDFAMGAHTIAFYYNQNALTEPAYTSLNFNNLDSCALGGLLPSYGQPQFSHSTLLGIGEANVTAVQQVPEVDCPTVTNEWMDVGRVCFKVSDPALSTNLQFNENLTLLNLANNQPAHQQGSLLPLDVPAGCSVGMGAPAKTIAAIHPNPAGDRLWVRLDKESDIRDIAEVLLFDLSGNLVGTAAPQPDLEVETQHLQTGAYFLALRSKSGQITGTAKFLKL